MTVIAGVLTDAGVLLAADRAAINPNGQIADGVFAPLPDRTKLVTMPSGVAVALAGAAGTTLPGDGDAADVLRALPAALATASDALTAAGAVQELFERSASAIRRYAAAAAEETVPPFERPVLTVALVAGPGALRPRLYAVGLTVTGRCLLVEVDEPGTAYAPGAAVHDVEAAVADIALTGANALERLGGAIAGVARRHPNLVSVDWDHVVVGADGSGGIHAHRHTGVTIGRL